MSVRAVFAMPLCNGSHTLPEALESLLAQSERRLAVAVVDAAHSEDTATLVGAYAALDDRIEYRRTFDRLGVARTWRRALELAFELHPDAPYFAWAAQDHVWNPRWLASLTRVLDDSSDVALAYPRNELIDARSELVPSSRPGLYDSRGLDLRSRLRTCTDEVAADAVFGLVRVAALMRTGPLRYGLETQRLIVRTVATRGHVTQIPETLWYRRATPEQARGRSPSRRRHQRPPRQPVGAARGKPRIASKPDRPVARSKQERATLKQERREAKLRTQTGRLDKHKSH